MAIQQWFDEQQEVYRQKVNPVATPQEIDLLKEFLTVAGLASLAPNINVASALVTDDDITIRVAVVDGEPRFYVHYAQEVNWLFIEFDNKTGALKGVNRELLRTCIESVKEMDMVRQLEQERAEKIKRDIHDIIFGITEFHMHDETIDLIYNILTRLGG